MGEVPLQKSFPYSGRMCCCAPFFFAVWAIKFQIFDSREDFIPNLRVLPIEHLKKVLGGGF